MPVFDEVVLSLSRMNRVLQLDPGAGMYREILDQVCPVRYPGSGMSC